MQDAYLTIQNQEDIQDALLLMLVIGPFGSFQRSVLFSSLVTGRAAKSFTCLTLNICASFPIKLMVCLIYINLSSTATAPNWDYLLSWHKMCFATNTLSLFVLLRSLYTALVVLDFVD